MMRALQVLAFAIPAICSSLSHSPDDSNLYYSPFTWHVTNTSAATINAGAYLRFLTSGTFLNFKFDVSHMVAPASEVYWRVDNGPLTMSLVLDSVQVDFPANNSADFPFHSVELIMKSSTERQNRWSATGDSTRIILTGIETDGELAPWVPSDVNLLIYGDSITEGVRALGKHEQYDTDRNDATMVYSSALGPLLGAEVGVVAFGATGLLRGGSGGVPAFGQTWNQQWDGVSRNFSNLKPDLIVLNEGTNDGCDTTNPGCDGNDITAAMTSVLKDLIGSCPGVPIAVVQPFNLGQGAHLMAAVAATGSPDVHYIDTTSVYNMKYGGDLHPQGPNHVAQIAPRLAQRLRPLLTKSLMARSEEFAV